jgi:transposase
LALKVEGIAYWYKLSERQVEVFVNENLPATYFVGLVVDGKAMDHSTLTVLRERLLKNVKMKIFGKGSHVARVKVWRHSNPRQCTPYRGC